MQRGGRVNGSQWELSSAFSTRFTHFSTRFRSGLSNSSWRRRSVKSSSAIFKEVSTARRVESTCRVASATVRILSSTKDANWRRYASSPSACTLYVWSKISIFIGSLPGGGSAHFAASLQPRQAGIQSPRDLTKAKESLKWHANGKNYVVIKRMEMRCGNLKSGPERQTYTIMDGHLPWTTPGVRKTCFLPAFVPFDHHVEFTSISGQNLRKTRYRNALFARIGVPMRLTAPMGIDVPRCFENRNRASPFRKPESARRFHARRRYRSSLLPR